MARALNLPIKYSKGGEHGCYRVPGGTDLHSYLGVVEGPVLIQLDEKVIFELPNVRVLKH